MKLPQAPNSLWLDTYGPYRPEPPLQGDIAVDVAIIGAGFAGLTAAYELKRADPGVSVAVLEAQTVGYGASGRNGSFGMTVIGLGFSTTAMLRGKRFVQDAHAYMERAVDYMGEVIQREGLDCEYRRPGFLRAATTEAYVRRIHEDIEIVQSAGFTGIDWIDAAEVRAKVDSPRYLGAMYERRLVLMHPVKLVREEKRLAMRLGAAVYENTPVLEVRKEPRFTVRTLGGTVRAEKVLFATNAYSDAFAQLRYRQIPAFTYMVATEPLSDAQMDAVGWAGGEGVEDARNLIHYYRITPDRRLVMGGGPVGLTYGGSLFGDDNAAAWRHLEEHIGWLFPPLKGIKITHRWGGPFSVTTDLTPAIGYAGDQDAVYTLGCIGHGVSASHLNALVLRDMLLCTEGSDTPPCPFLRRRVLRWPPEPLRSAAVQAIRGYLAAEDAYHERALRN